MFRNKSVDTHKFSMVPSADIPRSSFKIQTTHKTTFDAGYLVPIYVDEILPGDSFNVQMTAFCRLATPLYPVMDNLYLETFFFFVPMRLVWSNFKRFMGEKDNPADSTSYVIPTITSPASGWTIGHLCDYFGLPTVGQVAGSNTYTHNVLPLRAYNLIYNEWFRDENLQDSLYTPINDGPDANNLYALRRRGKRHDYFTSALPWTQKGNPVQLPLGSTAAVVPIIPGTSFPSFSINGNTRNLASVGGGTTAQFSASNASTSPALWQDSGLIADLSTATAATINQIRQAFQIQKLLERDARGGTRYTELVRSHFGVISPDARLQRPEYLGGGSTPINISPIAQTSATSITGGATPQGNLSAIGMAVAKHGFSQSFTEHGYIVGIANVRADLTYQQGVRKLWNRSTRYDFYFPVFAALGEQAILNREIYADGSANDSAVFGYQERWAEYRYNPALITGLFRSTASGTLDPWHLAQRFTSLPTLNTTFIQDTPPVSRIVAVGSGANGKQFLFDSFFDIRAARPLPMYSVPGLVDHF